MLSLQNTKREMVQEYGMLPSSVKKRKGRKKSEIQFGGNKSHQKEIMYPKETNSFPEKLRFKKWKCSKDVRKGPFTR